MSTPHGNDRRHDEQQNSADADRGTSPVHIVLGASGGIGSALSRRLAQDGARLLLAGRNEGGLNALAGELGAEHRVIDATRCDDVAACVEQAAEHFGRLDGIANCVGSLLLKPAHLTTEEEWRATIDTNLGSAFATVRAAAPAMRGAGGSIVLVASAAARIGLANHEAIAAAKAGVIGLARAAAASYGSKGVRVNVVAPGLVRTPMTRRITDRPAGEKASLALHALGRLGEPADVAALIAWLMNPDHDWVTGQVFGVDGGLGTVRA
jgi:NAD(P)-dependent dehydrogenase (short-subunit alcohol dehydrogenase family)